MAHQFVMVRSLKEVKHVHVGSCGKKGVSAESSGISAVLKRILIIPLSAAAVVCLVYRSKCAAHPLYYIGTDCVEGCPVQPCVCCNLIGVDPVRLREMIRTFEGKEGFAMLPDGRARWFWINPEGDRTALIFETIAPIPIRGEEQ